ncbi:hypothetical protein GGI42DRAFT_365794 [Trichoderma sp. SZMC 28013]
MDESKRLRLLLQEQQLSNAELQKNAIQAEERAIQAEERAIQAEERAIQAEERAALQPIWSYLDRCHNIDVHRRVITGRSSTTQGDATNPVGRTYPQEIREIWTQLSNHPGFFDRKVFPSPHQLEYIEESLCSINSEVSLRHSERELVENAVQKIVSQTSRDPILREALGLEGTEPRRGAKGKGGSADGFCVYKTLDGRKIPTVAIEYKPPHKLSVDELVRGLESEIRPDRDVIHQQDDGSPAFRDRALAAAVVTQLFSYMVNKGIRYGYICTGQAYCFLHIRDDPATVYYALCVPSRDVQDGDEDRLQFTAVARVYAFLLQAVSAAPPAESWYDEVEKLRQWDEEYDDVLSKIPLSDRKRKERRPTPYKPRRWKGFTRSPVQTRSRGSCKPSSTESMREEEDDSDDDDDGDGATPTSPTTNASTKAEARARRAARTGGSNSNGRKGQDARKNGQRRRSTRQTHHRDQELAQGTIQRCIGGRHYVEDQPSVEDQPYCTHQCLLALAFTGPLDPNCPNVGHHGRAHVALEDFLRLAKEQLTTRRGPNANCAPLFLSGARGALFKVRLLKHGYTFIAKGVQDSGWAFLQHERDIYHVQLRSIQGQYVPVCLGMIDLERPRHSDGRLCTRFLFLSWCGKSLSCVDSSKKRVVAEQAIRALKAIHELGVIHNDAELRNVVYNPVTDKTMMVDFELSKPTGRRPLELINPNRRGRGRGAGKRTGKRKAIAGEDEFDQELRRAQSLVDQWVSPSNVQMRGRDCGVAKVRRMAPIHSSPTLVAV